MRTFARLFFCIFIVIGSSFSLAEQQALTTDEPRHTVNASDSSGQVESSIEDAQESRQAQIQRVNTARSNSADFVSTSTLREKYAAYQIIRKAQGTKTPQGVTTITAPGDTQAHDFYAPTIKAVLVDAGVIQPFAAVFDVLGSFGDPGSGSVPAAQSGIQTQLFGRIDWESSHWGYENIAQGDTNVGFKKKVDLSLAGSLGLYPALVMENLTSSTERITQPKNRPMFQNAFRWFIGPRINLPLASHAEATAFYNLGQNFLIDQVSSFKEGDNTVVATPVSNDAGRAAAFNEGGVQFRVYAKPIWVVHDNKGTLTPLFFASAGVRKDERFNPSGDLAGFDQPRLRNFFQFFITLTDITKFSDDVQPNPPASVRFGVDIERAIVDDRIPTATRFFVSGNFDVMKIFHPSTSTP